MCPDGTERVADFILNLRWENLPAAVQARARLCFLDGLGAVLGGTLTPVSRLAAEFAAGLWPGTGASILGHDRLAQAAGAAFANACAGNGLDIDDDAIFTRGHPGAQLIPTVLALAEEHQASGRAMLEALVVGYEVAIRAGRCWHALHPDYQACGSWGSVACAAAAARLLGLSREQTQQALGIAEYHAPNAPMLRDVTHPSMVKHAIGWGAMNGIISAQLAQRGFTGIPSLLGFEPYQPWVDDIGRQYWMAEWVFFKGWASCAWGHAACQAAWQLMQAHRVSSEQIEHIRVRTFEEALLLPQGYPTTTEEAQFSLRWPLACLLVDGEIGPTQVLAPRWQDPAIRGLFERIELTLDPQIDRMYKETQEMDLRMYSAVEIRLKDGRVLDSGLVERGADRWDAAALEQKFRWLAGFVLKPEPVEQLIQLARRLEHLDNLNELIGCVNVEGRGEPA